MVPIHFKITYVHVTAYKYKCLNTECETKVIMETLNFASASQVRTTELTSLILAVSLFLDNDHPLSEDGSPITYDNKKRNLDS